MSYRFIHVTVTFLQTGATHQVPTWVEDPEEALKLTRLTYSNTKNWDVGLEPGNFRQPGSRPMTTEERQEADAFVLDQFRPKTKASKKKEPVPAATFKCRWCKDRVGGCLYCR